MSILTKYRKDSLRAILRKEKKKLETALHMDLEKQLGEDYVNASDPGMDRADLSFMKLQESLGVQVADIWQDELRKITEAERKLDDGTYGVCEICGKEISERRLSALPFAIYCVPCAERVDRGDIRGAEAKSGKLTFVRDRRQISDTRRQK